MEEEVKIEHYNLLQTWPKDLIMEGMCLAGNENSSNNSELNLQEIEPLLCLVCGERDGTVGVFQRVGATPHCRDPIIQRLGRILQKSVVEIELRSEMMCKLCITLLQDYERLEFTLVELQRKVIQSYRKAASLFKKTSCEQIDEVNEEAEIKIEKNSKRSPAWAHFDKILDEEGNIIKVHCNICDRFLAYSNNTSGMVLHLRTVHNIKIQPKSTMAEEIERPAKRSESWDYFEKIYDEKGEIVSVKCTICERLLSYRNNTSGMIRHLREIHKKKFTSRMFADELVEVHTEPFETDPSIENIVVKEENDCQIFSRRSAAWSHFEKVYDEKGNMIKVRCIHCSRALTLEKNKNTSGLIRHLRALHADILYPADEDELDLMTLEVTEMLDGSGKVLEKETTDEVPNHMIAVEPIGKVESIDVPSVKVRSRKSSTWDHFEEIEGENGRNRVQCNHCQKILSYDKNTSGMIRHLRSNHNIQWKDRMFHASDVLTLELSAILDDIDQIQEGPLEGRGVVFQKPPRRSQTWDHFEKIYRDDGSIFKVKCHHCDQLISFPNNTSGMVRHLRLIHEIHPPGSQMFTSEPEMTLELSASQDGFEETTHKHSGENKPVFQKRVRRSAAWDHFKKIRNEEYKVHKVKCNHCHYVMSFPNNTSSMIRHLRDVHDIRVSTKVGLFGKSEVERNLSGIWNHYEKIVNDEGHVIQVECCHCHAVMSSQNNLRGMIDHLEDIHGVKILYRKMSGLPPGQIQKIPVEPRPLDVSKIIIGNEKEIKEQNISLGRGKNKRKRSPTWDYFEEIQNEEGRIIKVECHHCHVVMNFPNNTSGMIRHLRDVHGLKFLCRTKTDSTSYIQEVHVKQPKPFTVSDIRIENEKETQEQSIQIARKKKKKKRSPTWDYFEKILNEEGQIIKVKCHHCHIVMNFPNNTSGMIRHLRDVHSLKLFLRTHCNSDSSQNQEKNASGFVQHFKMELEEQESVPSEDIFLES